MASPLAVNEAIILEKSSICADPPEPAALATEKAGDAGFAVESIFAVDDSEPPVEYAPPVITSAASGAAAAAGGAMPATRCATLALVAWTAVPVRKGGGAGFG